MSYSRSDRGNFSLKLEKTNDDFLEISRFFENIKLTNYLFVFDWDDTLFPRSYLSKNGYYKPYTKKLSKNVCDMLQLIEFVIIKIFQNILVFGNIVIISNSDKEWIERTCKIFMPNLYLFIQNNILYLSAKNLYDKKYPNEPVMWKACAMKYVMNIFNDETIDKNVISIGDSMIDYAAIRAVSKYTKMLDVQTIKFMENPSINQLRSQLICLKENIKKLTKNAEKC